MSPDPTNPAALLFDSLHSMVSHHGLEILAHRKSRRLPAEEIAHMCWQQHAYIRALEPTPREAIPSATMADVRALLLHVAELRAEAADEGRPVPAPKGLAEGTPVARDYLVTLASIRRAAEQALEAA